MSDRAGFLYALAWVALGFGAWGCGDDEPPKEEKAALCGPGRYCTRPEVCIDGVCKEISTVCAAEKDCPLGLRCEDHQCVEPCVTDVQCPQEQVCDKATGRCLADVRDCRSTSECPLGKVCVDLRCQEPQQCEDDEFCTIGVCVDGQCLECRDESTCEEGQLCQENRCVTVIHGCSDADPCPGSQVCTDGRCLEPARCTGDLDCYEGRYCFAEHCAAPCDPLAQTGCPLGFSCSDTGRCELVPCTPGGDDCAPGLVCRDGSCQLPLTCTDDPSLCRSRQTCESGFCVEPRICETDVDCFAGRYCLGDPGESRCSDPCLDDGGCPEPFVCLEATGRCVEPEGICRSSDYCSRGAVCENGICRPQEEGECRNDGDCPRIQRCIGLSCSAAPLPACEDDRQCLHGMICGTLRSCETPASCTADAQCPRGMSCDQRTARCAECFTDADCPEGGRCRTLPGFDYPGCAEPPFCTADEDCRGDRVCGELAVCEDPACVDDAASPNQFPAQSTLTTARTFPELVLCSGKEDWFSVQLTRGWGLVVTLHTDPVGPDINAAIYAEHDPVHPLAQGSHLGGVEQVVLGSAPADGSYLVRVYAPPGYSVPYSMRVEVPENGACAQDGLEGPRGNDTPEAAVPASSGLLSGMICPGDQDHYALQLAEGVDLLVRLLPDPGAELVLALTRDGEPVAEPVPIEAGSGLQIEAHGLQGGSYLLRVAGATAQTRAGYSLQVHYPLEAGQLLTMCADAPLIVPGVPVQGTTAGPRRPNGFSASCDEGLPLGPESLYRLDLESDSELTIDLTAEFDALLSIRADCLDDAQEVFCQAETANRMRLRFLPRGSYWLVVDGQDAASGPFQLTVEVSPSDLEPPPNDSCRAPQPVVFEEHGEQTISGTTVDALSNFALSCHAGTAAGPDVVYELVLAQESRLTVLLETQGLNAVLGLTGGRCLTGEELGCSYRQGMQQSLFFERLAAGTYHLLVDGTGVVQEGSFTLIVRADDPDAQLPGSSCATAIELVPEQRQVHYLGTTFGAPSSFAGASCAAGETLTAPDLVHRLVVDRPSLLVGHFRPQFDGVLALLEQSCAMQREVACTGADFFSWPVDAGENYLVVEGADAGEQGDYLIALEVIPSGVLPPDNDTCARPEALRPQIGQHIEIEGTLAGAAANYESHSCGDPVGTRAGADVVYALELVAPGVLSAQLAGAGGTVLYLHASNCESVHDVACGESALPPTTLEPGLYYLIVDATAAGNAQDFLLLIDLAELPPEPPANDSCSAPVTIEASGGPTLLHGDTRAALDDFAGGACVGAAVTAGSPDVVYRLVLDRASLLDVAIEPDFDSVVYLAAEPCGDGIELACDDDHDELHQRLPAGTYYLFVDGYQGARGTFDLTVSLTPLELAPEDVCETAPLLPLDPAYHGEVAGSTAALGDEYRGSCGGEGGPDAAHRVVLPRRGRVRAALDAAFDGRVHLHGADCIGGPELACGVDGLVSGSLPAGTYHLVVDGSWAQASGAYRLGVELDLAADNETCELARAVELDEAGHGAQAASTVAASDDYATACGGAGAGDTVFLIELDRPSHLQLSVAAAFDARLALLEAGCDPGAALGCGGDTLRVEGLAAGSYYLVVDGHEPGDEGPFTLHVDAIAIFDPPANDLCATAAIVPLQAEQTQVVSGDLTHARDDGWLEGCGGLGGNDVYYQIDIDEPGQLRATIAAAFQARLYLVDGCVAPSPLACANAAGLLASGILPQGSYVLAVDAADELQSGAFDLALDLVPVNDTCPRAHEITLSAGSGTASGSTAGGVSHHTEPACGAGTDQAPERFYHFVLTELSDVTVLLDAPFSATAILLAGSCVEPLLVGCGELVQARSLPPDEYWVVVDGLGPLASGEFTVAVTATRPQEEDPLALACAAALELQLDEQGHAAAHGEVAGAGGLGVFAPAGCPDPGDAAASPEALFRFTLDEAALVDIDLSAAAEPAALYVGRGLCALGLEEEACLAPATSLHDLALPPGTHHLIVDGTTAAGPGAFDLELQARPVNATCEHALPLALDHGFGTAQGDTRLGATSFAAAACGEGSSAGSDLFFSFTVDALSDVVITVTPGFGGVVALTGPADPAVACAEAPVLGCGRSLHLANLLPGTYGLVADDLGFPGELTATVQLLEPANPPRQDLAARCALAETLALEPGVPATVQGETTDDWSAFSPLVCAPQGPGLSWLSPEDAYTFTLDQRSRLQVSLWPAAPAIVALGRGQCTTAEPVACGPAPHPWEHLTLPAGDYVLVVDGLEADGPGAYTLEARFEPAPLTNDTCALANPIALDEQGRAVIDDSTAQASSSFASAACAAGTDVGADLFYTVALADWSTLELTLQAGFAGTVALLAGACGDQQVLACGAHIATEALPPATYTVVVDGLGADQGGDFLLRVAAVPAALDPVAEKCQAALALSFTDGVATAQGSSAGQSAALAPLTCGEPGEAAASPEQLYRFTLEEPRVVSAELVSAGPAVLYLSRGSCTARDELACVAGSTLAGRMLPADTYHLVVDGMEPAGTGPFELTLTASPLPETCLAALPLPLDEGRGVAVGSTALARADFASGTCPAGSAAGRDLFYTFEVPALRDAQVMVDPAFGGVAAVIGPGPCDAAPVLGCGRTISLANLPPGTYRLAIDDLGLAGPFAVQVSLFEPANPPPAGVEQRCQLARTLILDADGHAAVEDQTDDAFSGFRAPAVCPPTGPAGSNLAPEDVWELALDAPSRVTVRVVAARPAVTYLGAGTCRQQESLACGHGATPLNDVILGPGSYTLVVDGEQIAGPGAYTLEVQASPLPPNDTCAAATALPLDGGGLARYHGSTAFSTPDFADPGCGADTALAADQFFTLELPQSSVLDIDLVSAGFDGVVALARGECADGLQVLGCGAAIDSAPLPRGTYYLIVDGRGAAAQGEFRLNVRATPVQETIALKCTAAAPLDWSEGMASAAGTTDGASAVASPGSCLDPGEAELSPEVVHAFTLDTASVLGASVTSERPAVLYLFGASCSPLEELACGPHGELPELVLPPGTYHLVMDGRQAGGPGAYELEVWTAGVAAPRDTCGEAQTVHLGVAGNAQVAGDTSPLSDDFGSDLCGGGGGAGPDAYYQVVTEAWGTLSLDLPAAFPGAVVALLAESCAAPRVVACGSAFTSPLLPPGTYWLVVDGRGAADAGAYTLAVSLQASDPPGSDSCAAPGVIDVPARGGSVVVPGNTSFARPDLQPLADACGPGAADGGDLVYRLEVPAAMSVRATVLSGWGAVAYLTRPCGEGAPYLCASAGSPGQANLPAGTYFLIVDGPAFGGGSFTATLDFTVQGNTCDDPIALGSFAGDASLQVQGDTAQMSGSHFASSSCVALTPAKDLVYAFDVQEETRVSAEVAAAGFVPVLRLRSAPCELSMDLSCSRANPAAVSALVPAGDHFLVVDGAAAADAGPFTLELLLESLATLRTPACAAAPVLASGVGVAGDTTGGENLFVPSCGGMMHAAPDEVYTFTVAGQPADVVVQAEPACLECYRPLVALYRSCTDAGGELGCVGGQHPSFRYPRLRPGTYFVVVDGTMAASGAYTLTYTAGPAQALRGGDTCAAADPLALPPGTTVLVGSTAGKAADLALSCGAAGAPDAVFALTVNARSVVALRVTGFDYEPALAVRRAPCSDGPELLCLPQGQEMGVQLEAGQTYYLVVGAGVAGGSGEFRLEMTRTAL